MSEFKTLVKFRGFDSLRSTFAQRATRASSGCLVWTGGGNSDGYGHVYVGTNAGGRSVMRLTHRVWYELHLGPVPEGLQLDHLCRNRACCEPSHLEPVTCRENLMRGETVGKWHAAKTHCPRGHEYSDENTKQSRGRRVCKTCRRLLDAQRDRAGRVRSKIPAAGGKPKKIAPSRECTAASGPERS